VTAKLLQFLVLESLRTLLGAAAKDGEMLLQESIDALERYYLVNKVSQSWEILNRGVTVRLKDGFRNPFMEAIESYLLTKEHVDPQVAIFLQLYLTTKYPEKTEYFEELLLLLEQSHDKVNEKDFRNLYLATINTSIRYMRVDVEKYTIITLDLYVKGIETKILFERGILSPWTYSNAVKLGLRLKRFGWVKAFINEYNSSLAEEERKNAFYANSAELAFAQSQYDLTLKYLKEVNTKYLKYYLSTQVLYIKSFYETNNVDSW